MDSESISSAALVGCTGLIGSQILATLAALPQEPTIIALARKALPASSSKDSIKPLIESDSSKWAASIRQLSPPPSVFLSALGTTKAAAGSVEAQRKIDYDLNLSLATAAKESGVKVYVLISSDAVSTKSLFAYGRMKAELEEAVKALKFTHTVILKPGLLLGSRQDSRPAEAAIRKLAGGLGSMSKSLTDFWAQDANVVGNAAVAAGIQCVEGERKEGVWIVSQSEIIRLGRTEWRGKK
ncbi:oxidoreductase, partial [Lecanoromycetidae sp. Uapishka_2]